MCIDPLTFALTLFRLVNQLVVTWKAPSSCCVFHQKLTCWAVFKFTENQSSSVFKNGILVIFMMGCLYALIHLDCHAGCPKTGLAAANTWWKHVNLEQKNIERIIHIFQPCEFITHSVHFYGSQATTVPPLIVSDLLK